MQDAYKDILIGVFWKQNSSHFDCEPLMAAPALQSNNNEAPSCDKGPVTQKVTKG